MPERVRFKRPSNQYGKWLSNACIVAPASNATEALSPHLYHLWSATGSTDDNEVLRNVSPQLVRKAGHPPEAESDPLQRPQELVVVLTVMIVALVPYR
jgi:hypothetical protein